MQVIAKKWPALLLLLLPATVKAQSTLFFQGEKHAAFLQRLEIKLQRHTPSNLLLLQPVERKAAVGIARYADSLAGAGALSLDALDQQQLRQLWMACREWVDGYSDTLLKGKRAGRSFFGNPASFFEVKEKDFYLAANPVLHFQRSVETGNRQPLFLNTRGFQLRGLIGGRVGFSAYLTDNQERGPAFVQARIDSMQAVPGVGWYKPFKQTATDYLDARGSIHFNATRFLSMQFGYDKQFMGYGYRSLFLSDVGNSYLFFKVNTQVWKFRYTTLFMELSRANKNGQQDQLFDKKYAAIHHLGVQATPWLTVGVFDAVVFGRKNHFDFSYVNPVIFLRAAEQQNGSADNSFIGLDVKANLAKSAQVYGQLLLDEFLLKEMRSRKGWWANKYGLQLGFKYIDLFGIPHMDVQAEINAVRPFTYAHYDSISTYSHYKQPLAHPLGANFREWLFLLRYQPHVQWITSIRLIGWQQGLDSSAASYGSNIFKLVTARPANDYGYFLHSGARSQGLNVQMLVSYEWKENLYVEASCLWRKLRRAGPGSTSLQSSTLLSLGIRWNIFRREYDY